MESFTVRKLSTKAGTSVYSVLLRRNFTSSIPTAPAAPSSCPLSPAVFRSFGEAPQAWASGAPGTDLPKGSAAGREPYPETFIVNFKMESGYEQTQKRRETSQTQK